MRYGAVNLIHSSKCLINITILAAKAMIRAHKTFISSLAVLNVPVRFIHELKILYSLWRNSFFSFAYGFFRNKNKTFICMVSKNCILVRKKDMSAELDRFGKIQIKSISLRFNWISIVRPIQSDFQWACEGSLLCHSNFRIYLHLIICFHFNYFAHWLRNAHQKI